MPEYMDESDLDVLRRMPWRKDPKAEAGDDTTCHWCRHFARLYEDDYEHTADMNLSDDTGQWLISEAYQHPKKSVRAVVHECQTHGFVVWIAAKNAPENLRDFKDLLGQAYEAVRRRRFPAANLAPRSGQRVQRARDYEKAVEYLWDHTTASYEDLARHLSQGKKNPRSGEAVKKMFRRQGSSITAVKRWIRQAKKQGQMFFGNCP